MNNTPPGYWHLGNAHSIEYAHYLAEKHMEATPDGGFLIEKKDNGEIVKWAVYAQDKKKK